VPLHSFQGVQPDFHRITDYGNTIPFGFSTQGEAPLQGRRFSKRRHPCQPQGPLGVSERPAMSGLRQRGWLLSLENLPQDSLYRIRAGSSSALMPVPVGW